MSPVPTETYAELHARSLSDPDGFWLDAARALSWDSFPSAALGPQPQSHDHRWFEDGTLNLSFNALDRHVHDGRGEQAALVYESAMTGARESYSYSQLTERVARFAGALHRLGVGRGDRVLIYMPMIPEAAIAMLAAARLGAVHSVVFGGFAAAELAVRVDDVRPRVVVTATGGLEPGRVVEYLPLVRDAIEGRSDIVETVVVWERDEVPADIAAHQAASPQNWLSWRALEAAAPAVEAVPVRSTDPLYILHTSGTTGNPKGVVRDCGGYGVALSWAMANIFGIAAGDRMFTASDVGWVVGHSFIVYGPLLAGATTVLYEGKPVGTPDAGAFWRVAAHTRANVMFTAPTALRAIRRVDPDLDCREGNDLSELRALFVAGERMDPDTLHWIGAGLDVPVIDNWWQTETGWPICAVPLAVEAFPVKAGSACLPMPGYDVRILASEVDAEAGPDDGESGLGSIAIALPLPPGAFTGIWGSPERYYSSYFEAAPGHYMTGDTGYIDEDGYVFVMGRFDDVINVAGHRLSTGAFEGAITQHPAVAECAVVGAHDALKGQRAVAFVTVQAAAECDAAALRDELVALVRAEIGPVAAFREVHVVDRLPKTRSGKILRRSLRQILDGQTPTPPATIEDPSVIHDLVRRFATG